MAMWLFLHTVFRIQNSMLRSYMGSWGLSWVMNPQSSAILTDVNSQNGGAKGWEIVRTGNTWKIGRGNGEKDGTKQVGSCTLEERWFAFPTTCEGKVGKGYNLTNYYFRMSFLTYPSCTVLPLPFSLPPFGPEDKIQENFATVASPFNKPVMWFF